MASSKEYTAKLWAEIKTDPVRHEKIKAERRAYRASRPELKETPEQSLLRRYKKSWDDIYELWLSQGESCAVCGISDTDKWCIDHDHACCPGARSCGKCVRGILCDPCNKALGHFYDDIDTIQAAADYLRGKKVS